MTGEVARGKVRAEPAGVVRAAVGMMFAPVRGAAVAARAPLWAPLVILAGAAALSDYPILIEHGATWLIDIKLRTTPEGFSRITILLFLGLQFAAPLVLPLVAWLAGLLMDFYLSFLLDLRTQRREVLRVTAYGLLPVAMGRIAAGIAHFVWTPGNPFNPFPSNLGFLFDSQETPAFWYEFQQGLDLFSVWGVVVTSVGLGALSGRPAAATLPVLGSLWLIGVGVRAWLLS